MPSNYRSILCLNGTLPDASFFQDDLTIVAADGAANTLMNMGITPDIVIGDLDSITPEHLAQVKSHYHLDQNYCDFEKSLMYMQDENLLPSIIVGMNGGFLDHILNNINIVMQSSHVFYAPPLCGYVIRANETKTFSLPLNTKISLFGIPSANISTQGLKWELQNSLLNFPGATSSFNRNNNESVHISVTDGSALILIYNLSGLPSCSVSSET